MLFFKWGKDGGKESLVRALYLIEIKNLFSVVLLKFKDGSREAYHSHAFNAISWVIKGELQENLIDGQVKRYCPSLKPIYTGRDTFHKIISVGNTYALTFRGPWNKTWNEFLPLAHRFQTLSWGRKIEEAATKD